MENLWRPGESLLTDWIKAKVLNREHLNADTRISGPAILEEYDTTVFVPPGYTIHGDANGNIIGEADL